VLFKPLAHLLMDVLSIFDSLSIFSGTRKTLRAINKLIKMHKSPIYRRFRQQSRCRMAIHSPAANVYLSYFQLINNFMDPLRVI